MINTAILRLHNVYGPPCETSHEKSQVIPSLCRKLILDEKYIIWGSGKQRRSFVYISDVVNALMKSISFKNGHEVIQIGPNKSTSIMTIAEKLLKISNKNVVPIYDTLKPEGDFDRVPDTSKAQNILSWKQETQIDEGLESTYKWCFDHLMKNR